ncbi:type II secretion system ATPase GspE [Pedomonas mirosovicensis]|uniref:type II secretion system ATPase GspE n=1 Tax=Pedomonas mirosovicensis TaxID=2908641 RepID=UPI0021685378|nr:type II secretion system ATPase GspE [Pedomonas mirosovicensis]MCH8686347.1 type II secretion system ATPase GspE [Pedomonas mirosovicensis]
MSGRIDPILHYSFAKDYGVVLLEGGERPCLGVREEASIEGILEARRAIGRPIVLQRISRSEFERCLSELYSAEGIAADVSAAGPEDDDFLSLVGDMPQTADLLDTGDDAPVIRLINSLIAEAARKRASDIHVEPFETQLSVRLRLDGVLQEVISLPARLSPLIVSRIKVMARLDIAEKRVPQDGRISLTLGGRALDVRVSTLPSRHGERVVMRLLDKEQAHFSLESLGMPEATLVGFRRALLEPHGIVLVTGPTGSGKTTSLYAGLALLNDRTRNILTVEDPVEYSLDGVGQTQVNAKVGMTFAAGLRAILRQDPDVVMVGEIRDVETAQIAVQASLTGHLVLSTVHTNTAVGAITRLRDMGVESFLLSSTIRAILAQRLVRRLCPHCKEPHAADASERAALGLASDAAVMICRPKGCAYCNSTGYAGRIGIYEFIEVTEELRRLIHGDASEQDIASLAFRNADTLMRSGARHVLAGITSLAEVLRVCREE